jgi:O-antigen ligase
MSAVHGRAVPFAPARGEFLATCTFYLIFLLIWITTTPFADLAITGASSTADSSNAVNQVAFVAMALLAVGVAVSLRKDLLYALPRPIHAVLGVWLLITIALSQAPMLSAKRAMFTLLVLLIAAAAITLPRTSRQLAKNFAAVTLLVVTLCYAGVLLVPDLAIHQSRNVLEPENVGYWRGVFAHKNTASAMMVVFLFIGLFVARAYSVALGWTIVALTLPFLYASGGKTALALVVPVLGASWLCSVIRAPALRSALVVSAIVLLNVITVGSAVVPAIGSFTRSISPDATFTGRTEIWQFAAGEITRHPVFGAGFAAFWRTDATVNSDAGTEEYEGWSSAFARRATDSHNTYVDLSLTIGLVGLAIVLTWVVILPLRDIARTSAEAVNSPLGLMLFRIWFYGLLTFCLESGLLASADMLGFMVVFAVFGIELMARFKPAPRRVAARRQNRRGGGTAWSR